MIGSCISILNDVSSDFCRYALAMLIQSSILIALLLVADLFLRKRVRAVVRYSVWILVFVKLILPPTLHLPTGIGCWFGDYLSADSAVMTTPDPTSSDTAGYALTDAVRGAPAAAFAESSEAIISHAPDTFADTAAVATSDAALPPTVTWQAALFLGWLGGVLLLAGFVIRRVLVIRGYVVRSQPAQGRLTETLNECRDRLSVRRTVELRITQQDISPAAYGVLRPKILLSASALSSLSPDRLKTVLIHELAHIKRGDLWMNITQSVLQVIYFYNPLVWLANAIVRQVREQAVDEMVLVCLGNEPRDYSSTLVDIAELALPQASLGLQLIGVVESRKALAKRVRHIMTRPIPRTARVGIIRLAAIVLIAAVLLPMARAKVPAPAASPVANKDAEQVDQQITGAQLMEDSMIVDGIMPAIKLAVEGKVGEERPRIPRIHSEPGPGVLHGIIKDKADTSRHLAALFFAPVEKWPGRALFWYLANVNQSFEITGIPPGEYHLFSVETSNPRNIDSVGLPVDWPRPVNIRADGEAAEVEIKVSSWLSKKARWWNMQGFLRGLGHLNAENVVTEQLGPYGRVTDSEGNPLPYAHIQVRGLEANGKDWEVVSSPDARTNQQGYYGVAPLDCPYFVGAIVHEPLKDAPGYRWRHLKRNRIFKGKQEINFQFAPWPAQLTGGGTIEGTVVDANGEAIPSFTTVLYCYCGCKSWRTFEGSVIDANGEAIPSFTVDVRGGEPFVWPHEANEPWSERWGLRAAFANGKFVIEDVPAGACNIRVSSHKSSSAGGATLATSQATVAGGKTVQLTFEVEDWQTKRGYRPVFRPRSGRRPTAEEEPREPLPELNVGEQAPAFEIQTVDDEKWALADYRGKVVLLCFWQAHHQPTEVQFPYFKSTYETFGADERFVMMSLVRKARRLKDLQQYATKYGLNWNHALMDEQVRQQLATAYGVQRWPSVILIGPDGKIIARNLKGNAMSWAVEKALKIQTANPK